MKLVLVQFVLACIATGCCCFDGQMRPARAAMTPNIEVRGDFPKKEIAWLQRDRYEITVYSEGDRRGHSCSSIVLAERCDERRGVSLYYVGDACGERVFCSDDSFSVHYDPPPLPPLPDYWPPGRMSCTTVEPTCDPATHEELRER